VKLANLETILLQQDVANRAELYCLSCRRRLASVVLADRFREDGAPESALSVTQLSDELRDFQQRRRSISLTCGCSIRSTYHLLV
jgi:hypothetical protein